MSNLFLSIAVLYSQAPLIFIDHSMWHSCSIQCSIESLAAFDGWNHRYSIEGLATRRYYPCIALRVNILPRISV